jgi:uncharacterized membrane protein
VWADGRPVWADGRPGVVEGRRLAGVDAARGVALLGMMSVHIVPRLDADGSVSLAYLLASGRASALFAVLAGVGLALARATPGGACARAAVVAAIGLTLGLVDAPVAIILVHYGVLFCCAAPFLRLPARVLGPLAAAWLVLSPVLAHLLRPLVPPGPGGNPSWLSLSDPARLLTELVLTGYYPVLQWAGYLLAGLAVGRLALQRTAVASALLAAGALVATAAAVVSAALLGPLGGSAFVDTSLRTYGTTPTGTWWWLAVASPHSGTPFDLLHTAGSAVAVLGGWLLLARAARTALVPLAAAGSMTLTLYSLHVLALGLGLRSLAAHAVLAVAGATLWRSTGQRGPLEALATRAARAVSRRG